MTKGILLLLLLVILLIVGFPPRQADARAVVDDVNGPEATVVLLGHPQPNRYVVRWEGELVEGQALDVRLAGRCRCQVVPARADRSAVWAYLGVMIGVAILALITWAWPLLRVLQRRQASAAAQGAANLPMVAESVWIRPRWLGRGRPRLHVDVHDRATGAWRGRLALDKVTIEMDPWVPYTLLGRDRAYALRSDDGRHLLLPVGPFDRDRDDSRVVAIGPTIDEAMRWGPTGDDPAWNEATKRTGRRAVLVALVCVAGPFVGLALMPLGLLGVVITFATVLMALGPARYWLRAPLRRQVRACTDAAWREADTAAAASAVTLIPTVAVTERRFLS